MYFEGRGELQDLAEGLKWYREAARQGDAEGQIRLGSAYRLGTGVPQDYAEAARWFALAAAQGDELGQYLLGYAYAQGEGVRRDGIKAYMWFNIAAATASGPLSTEIVDARDTVAGALTPAQLTEAQRQSRVCTASQFKNCGAPVAAAAQGTQQNDRVATLTPGGRRAPQLEATGSGFFVSAAGHIVTNAHVVEGCSQVKSPQVAGLRQVAIDKESDLALFASAAQPAQYAHLRGGRGPRPGEAVVAIGYPLHGILGSDPKVTTGTISSLSGLNNDRRNLQISAPIQPGNSGGPLLGENGALVGVVVASLDAIKAMRIIGNLPQNVNFAVSVGTLQSFLTGNGVAYAFETSAATRTSAAIAAEATRYAVLLECWK
jgi:uncharacterized protein